MDPTLTIALVLAIGWALSYRAKWRRAELQLTSAEAVSEFRAKLIDNQERSIVTLLEKLEAAEKEIARKEQLRKDAFNLYRGALDDLAAVRDGAAE